MAKRLQRAARTMGPQTRGFIWTEDMKYERDAPWKSGRIPSEFRNLPKPQYLVVINEVRGAYPLKWMANLRKDDIDHIGRSGKTGFIVVAELEGLDEHALHVS